MYNTTEAIDAEQSPNKNIPVMPTSSKLNVLMIEDNPSDQFLLTHMLQSTELNINLLLCADRLEKAIDILKNEVIHIILLDLFLPDSAGIESLQALKVYASKTPVVILSGQSDTKLSLKAITMGAQDYLLKGDFDVNMLSKTILYSIERMNNLEALRESNERYDLVSKATNDMVWDWNLVTGEVYRNKEGWRKLLKDEFDKRSSGTEEEWDLRIHPEDKEKVHQVKGELFSSSTRNLYEVECRILRNDNTYAYIQDRGYIMRNDEGKAVRLIGATQDISERKEAEIELKKLSLIAKETTNAVIITAPDGNIQWVNDAFTRITEYDMDEVVGKPVEFRCGPETKPEDKERMRKCLESVTAFECDIINYSKSGRKYWVHIQSQPQFDQNGKHTGFFALETDITSEKSIKEIIVNSEKRFRSLIENSTDGLTLVNSETIIIDTSFAAERILGYPRLEYIGKNRRELIHPDDQDLVENTFEEVIREDNTTRNIEYRIKKASGEYIWIESTFHNLLQDTSVNAVVINFRDISDRKEAAARLIESEEKYKYLFNNNPASILIWSIDDFKILEVNDTAVKQYGYNRSDFLNLNMLDLRVSDEYPRIREFARRANADPDFKVLYTWKHINKMGEEMYMNILSCRITYKGKNVILALATNVTEKVILEKKLAEEKQKRQLEVTEAVITAQENERQEIGRELHDNVNQILSSSRLYLGLAKTQEGVHHPFLDQTDKLINSAITEIRDLSHSLIPPSLNESELIEALNNIVNQTTKVGSVTIQKDFRSVDEDLLSDKLKLSIYRVVQEQFNNILKYAKANTINIKLVQEESRITLSVKDDGVGFDTTDKPKVGVGLLNIRTRASLFKGEMNINSQPGKGSELKVSFQLE